MGLVYVRPARRVGAGGQSGSVHRSVARDSVTVVFYERLDRNPGGVWVGYADGHLEFAATAGELDACRGELSIVRENMAGAATQPEPTTRPTITLRVLDGEGRAVAGALVGVFADFGDGISQLPRVCFWGDDGPRPAITDGRGEVTFSAAKAFGAKFHDQPTVPLFILDERHRLVARVELSRGDFAENMVREVRLSPACDVRVRLTSVGLRAVGRDVTWNNLIVFTPGLLPFYTMKCVSKENSGADLLLPPGDYGIEAYGTDCDMVHRYIRIGPGEREMNLQLDLPPDTTAELIGKPAPEFRKIKGWENGGPVTMAGLRGKVVLLDFWGYWCGPCVASMPALMKLYDQFKDQGLVIVAVHNDTADSIEDMDRKIATVKNEAWAGWNGRMLPFLIALDGGGPTRIRYSNATEDGATTAAYGITSYPTAVIVGRDGRVVGEFDVRDADAAKKMEKILKGE